MIACSPTAPVDADVRHRFIKELNVNLSLIAPAGSGKTRAISDRVAETAVAPNAADNLARTVLVTYTNKAADELRQRAGVAIRARKTTEDVLRAFERTFSGTIHSFASHLLRDFGHFIGVPAGFENAMDGELLWKRFLQSATRHGTDAAEQRIYRHCSFDAVRAVVEGWRAGDPMPARPGGAPPLDFSRVFAYAPKRTQSMPTVARGQIAMRSFLDLWESGREGFAALPEIAEGGAEFIELCASALAPASRWLRSGLLWLAARMHHDFREWRVSQSLLTYDDQISLAADLFQNADAAKAIRSRGYRIILDEAQDTDPQQFSLLIEAARPVDAVGAWNDGDSTPPSPGRFVMVGDFQQGIYSSRADLSVFRQVHDYITAPGVGESLTFTTTFRCDRAVLAFVNESGPQFLNGEGKQVAYVPLSARNDAGPGNVMRLPIVSGSLAENPTADDLLRAEGAQIGAFLRHRGLAGLGITAWNQIAILAPRTLWLAPLRQGLLSEGVRSVVLSQSSRNCDHPAHLWSAAVATVLTQPRNSWEIVGVLRDVYGISDAVLAEYAKGDANRFWLSAASSGEGPVSGALRDLADVRREIQRLPLSDAFELIDRRILRPRLRALPVERYGDTDRALSQMSAVAAKLECEGGDLVALAQELASHLEDALEAQGDDPSAVCLLTNHKSKGLEWPIVILPALFRPLSFERPTYPRIIRGDRGGLDVAFCSADAVQQDTQRALRIREEIGRLLYVSLTRAMRTLILCDDRELWTDGALAELCFAKSLRLEQEPERIDGLPTTLLVAPATYKGTAPSATPAFEVDLPTAAKCAHDVPQKLTPHRLVRDFDHEGPEARSDERTSLPFDSTQYGTWWHETMRTMPWTAADRWDGHVSGMLSSCPDRPRGEQEWAIFRRTPLAAKLRNARVIRTECPFIVPAGKDALEGVIDLVFGDGVAAWMVVDWKTSRSHTITSAILDYGPQIRPYRDVVAQMLGSAEALLYLTPTGEEALVA